MYRVIQSVVFSMAMMLLSGVSLANQLQPSHINGKEVISHKTREEVSTPANKEKIEGDQISLNTASVEELVTRLKGIGKKKAEAIVSYREQHGAFTSIEQLQEVPGIGPSFMEKNGALLKL